MTSHKILAYATAILALFAVLNYFFPLRTELLEKIEDVKVKEVLKEEREKIEIRIDKDIYRGERNWLLEMYRAATKMPYHRAKADALMKVVSTAINENDFNIAIIAANKIPLMSNKAEALKLIVQAAAKDKISFGYAVIAAERIPYLASKAEALDIIVDAGEQLLKKQKITEENLSTSHSGTSPIAKTQKKSDALKK